MNTTDSEEKRDWTKNKHRGQRGGTRLDQKCNTTDSEEKRDWTKNKHHGLEEAADWLKAQKRLLQRE